MLQYDYLIVGSGLFGAVCAYKLKEAGKRVLVVEQRDHIGGNAFSSVRNGIVVHEYGAHIFHTSNEQVWEFVNHFAHFNRFTNSPLANFKGEYYPLPFNMATFYKLWGTATPEEAMRKIDEQRARYSHITSPANLEEMALSLVGDDIYQRLIKGYTEKQWGKPARQLPAFIIKRIPLRFVYDNNYFDDAYQGIPEGGYTPIFVKLLEGVEVQLNCDFLNNREELSHLANHVVFTGCIDSYFKYVLGALEWRALRFEHKLLVNVSNYQGNAVVNYTDAETPYTRIIEHKHFAFGKQADTIITYEYPDTWAKGKTPYYPINTPANQALLAQYQKLAESEKNVIFGGRLGTYRYYNMDQVIEEALILSRKILK